MTECSHIETCTWHEWGALRTADGFTSRTYVGNETCEALLPDPRLALDLLEPVLAADSSITLVTPFLTDVGLCRALDLVEFLAPRIPPFEVVCNDWGLCARLGTHAGCAPVIGRLLVGQHRDPRWHQTFDVALQCSHERNVARRGGAVARLTYRRPSEALALQLQRCAIDQDDLLAYVRKMGVARYEIDNLPQGLVLTPRPDVGVTMHVPSVFVSAARDCRIPTGDRIPLPTCGTETCPPPTTVWRHPSFPGPLFHYCNGIYAIGPHAPDDLARPGIDRIVRCRRFAALG